MNVLSNYGTFVLYGLGNFILVGYVLRQLGKEAFGLVSLAISLTVFTHLLSTGVCQALTKHAAAAITKGDRREISELASTSLMWFVICGIIGAVAVAIMGIYLDRLFNIPPELLNTGRLAMQIMALNVLICFPFSTFQGVLWAHQRYDLTNVARAVAVILRVGGTILYFQLVRQGIMELIIISVLALVVERILWVVFANHVAGRITLGISRITRPAFLTLIGFGSLILVIHVANLLGYEAVKLLIGRELSLIDVGGYTVIASLALYVGTMVRSVANVIMPVASRLHAMERHETNVRLTATSTKYSMVISSAMCIMPVLLLRPFLIFWLGRAGNESGQTYTAEYISMLAQAATWLLLGQWCITTAVCILQILTGVGRVKFPAFVTLTWALGGLAGVWAYLHWVDNSLVAAVVVITVARVLGSVVHLFYGIAVLRIDKLKFLFQTIIKPGIAAAVACAAGVLLISRLDPYVLVNFILVVAASCLVYAIITWLVVFGSDDRDEVFRIARDSLSKIGLVKVGQ